MTTGSLELRGALALVTGAGSGIGRATALALARQGSRVLCVDREVDGARQVADECGAVGPAARSFGVDVADRAAMAALAAEVHGAYGPLDVLVNNAGVGLSARFADTSLEDWDWIVGINLMGVVHGCRVFGAAMVERGRGHVVNVSSGLGYLPRATEPAYVTTKAAVLALSRCLRADWGPRGVGVSAICPGVIATPIIRHTRFRGERAEGGVPARVAGFFARRGHPPALVARAVLGAIRYDRAVVPVGLEAHLGWLLQRVLPLRLADRLHAISAGWP